MLFARFIALVPWLSSEGKVEVSRAWLASSPFLSLLIDQVGSGLGVVPQEDRLHPFVVGFLALERAATYSFFCF